MKKNRMFGRENWDILIAKLLIAVLPSLIAWYVGSNVRIHMFGLLAGLTTFVCMLMIVMAVRIKED